MKRSNPSTRTTTTKEQSATRLQSADLAVSGKEILRLAHKVGKGWFGLLLSEAIPPHATVPNYILRALAFAAANVGQDAIKRMGLYRIENEAAVLSQEVELQELDDLKGLASSEFVPMYLELAADDDLARFVNYLSRSQCRSNDNP